MPGAVLKREKNRFRRLARMLGGAVLAASMAPILSAQPEDEAGCRLSPFRERITKTLKSIVVEKQEPSSTTNARGQAYRIADVSLSGTLDGCVVLEGAIPRLKPDYSYLYDVPDVSLPQEDLLAQDQTKPYPLPLSPGDGNHNPRFYAEGRFEAKDGAGIRFFFPATAEDWNQKLFLLQHGSGAYTRMGEELVPRAAGDPFAPGAGQNLFMENLMDKGYAVAYLRKDAMRAPGGVSTVRTREGKTLTATFISHVALPLALAEFAQNFIREQLGSAPRRTYYYGHSGGGITARTINLAPGANRTLDGRPIMDGFLIDDAGAGLYLPVVFRDGQDVLFREPAERALYAPTVEFAHWLYNPLSYLQAKRANANLLREKGLGDKQRYYEVRGSSHFDRGMARRYAARMGIDMMPRDSLDLSGLVSALGDILDQWVDGGGAPPPSRADVAGYAPALALPEVACPLGVYYAPGGAGTTRFAPFDGQSFEPELEEGGGAFLDMNLNGFRDRRDTVAGAWRRLGLLPAGTEADLERYRTCLAEAARELVRQRFLPQGSDRWYEQRAESLYRESGAVFQ